jgi:hypothetical protein
MRRGAVRCGAVRCGLRRWRRLHLLQLVGLLSHLLIVGRTLRYRAPREQQPLAGCQVSIRLMAFLSTTPFATVNLDTLRVTAVAAFILRERNLIATPLIGVGC